MTWLEKAQGNGEMVQILGWIEIAMFILVPVALIVLLFKRKKQFPLLAIAYYVLGFCLVYFNYRAVQSMLQLPDYLEQLDHAKKTVAITFVSSAIWIIYFKFSERVKNTFTQ